MTIPSTVRKAGPLLGNGSTTAFPFTFKVFAASDIQVTIANNLGIETVLVLNTHYTVTLNANQDTSPGGTVTYPISGTPLPSGSKLTIVGNLPYDQPLDLPSGGNFSPLALENELDRLTMQIQQLREQVGRALVVPVNSTATPTLPMPEASSLIAWNENAAGLENYPIADLATALAFATYRYDTFNGNGTTTQFTLSADPITLGNLDVAISGVTQVPGVDYTLASGVLQFTSAPANGTVILARFGEGIVAGPSMDSYDVRFIQAGTGAVTRTAEGKLRESVSVTDFGADPTGATDSTAAITAAFTYANSRKRTGLAATIQHPGATVVFPGGTYNVSGISTSFQVQCDVQSDGAGILVPAAYAGTVFTVGLTSSGDLLATADITLPDVYKPTLSSIVIGSTGVRVVNLNASVVRFGRIDYFDYATHFGGIGQGSVYCDFFMGQTGYANQIIRIIPGSGGWCNANNFFGGNFRLGGNRVTGQYHILMDGSAPATAIVGNNFHGTALEGAGAIYVMYAKNAYGNTFNGVYNETQGANTAVTVSGSTLTSVAHGLATGDMVMFSATVLPTGMYDITPYYVVATPTADTFEVSLNKGGTAVTFGSAGTSVIYRYQGACYFEGSGALTYNNVFNDMFSPPSVYMNFVENGTASNNGIQSIDERTIRVTRPSDIPVFRAGNRSVSAATRAVFAAYPTTVNPVTQPTLWTTGLSDQGLMFQASGTETGRLFNSAGVLFYEGDNNGVLGQIPSGFRSSSLTTLGTTSVPANGRAIVTLTLTGAAVGDYVVPHTYSALADGIAIAWARVSAADTVQICFHNWTGSPIDIAGAQLKALVYRSFY